MNKILVTIFLGLISCSVAAAQLALPKLSPRQEVSQIVGDGKIVVNYGRPSIRGRKVWGGLVPYSQVWRAGADENTTFEVSRDILVNGKALGAGKYGFHIIPSETDWVVVFSKASDQWGSFTYDEKLDALRLSAKPSPGQFLETMQFSFSDVTVSTVKVHLSWEKLNLTLDIDFGDVHGRALNQIREAVSKRGDDVRPVTQGASYVLNFRLANAYEEAIGWLDGAIKQRETFALLSSKSRLLAAMDRRNEAIEVGEKAVKVGKAANPPANTAGFERELAALKGKN